MKVKQVAFLMGLLVGWAFLLPWVAAAASPEALNLYERGRFELDDGQYAEALKYFDQALTLEPGDANFAIARGQALFKLSRDSEAEAQFNKLLERDPAIRGAAYVELGALYGHTKRFSQAVDVYTQAIAAFPQRVDLYMARGLMYMEMQDYSRAEADFRSAEKQDPKVAAAVEYYRAMTSLRQEDYTKAKSHLDAAQSRGADPALAKAVGDLRRSMAQEAKARKRWAVTASPYVQFDDNIAQDPLAGKDAGASQKSDISTGLNLTATGYFYNQRSGSAGVAYTFRGQAYRDFHEYDMLSHTVSAFYSLNQEPWFFRVQADMSVYFTHASGDTMTMYSVTPTLARLLGPDKRIEFFTALNRKLRHDGGENSDNVVGGATYYQVLTPSTSPNHAPVIARAGFQVEKETPDGLRAADYTSKELKAGVSFPLPAQIEGDLGFGLAQIDYLQNSLLYSGRTRKDKQVTFSAKAGRSLNDDFRVDFYYYHTQNDSNLWNGTTAPYDFTRNVYTLVFTGNF